MQSVYTALAIIIPTMGIILFMKWLEKDQINDTNSINEEHERLMNNIENSRTFQDIHNCELLFDRFTYSIAHRADYRDIFRIIENAIESRRCSIRAIQNVFHELRVELN